MATIKEDLTITGMSCRHCIDAVEGALKALPGLEVEEVGIGRARVQYEAGAVSPDAIEAAVEEAGYSVEGTARVS